MNMKMLLSWWFIPSVIFIVLAIAAKIQFSKCNGWECLAIAVIYTVLFIIDIGIAGGLYANQKFKKWYWFVIGFILAMVILLSALFLYNLSLRIA